MCHCQRVLYIQYCPQQAQTCVTVGTAADSVTRKSTSQASSEIHHMYRVWGVIMTEVTGWLSFTIMQVIVESTHTDEQQTSFVSHVPPVHL